MNTSSPRRALVLGGGGSVGNAWLIGVLAGLYDAGLDVTDADLIVGTSAGATAAAQITNRPLPELYAAILAEVPPQRPAPVGGGRPPVGSQSDHMERTQRIIDSSTDAADMRCRMGAAFLEPDAASGGGGTERWRRTVAARLPGYRWPERQRLLLTAVDAHTGEGVAFDQDNGVELVDAVAASTSGGSAYWIGNRQCIDGGYRRNENADLAAGAERVLVLSPFGGRTRHPLAWGMQLESQIDELRAASLVETVFPDAAALDAFGDSMLDLSRRPPAARAGFEHGRARAEVLSAVWR